jgi:hypothetical protein
MATINVVFQGQMYYPDYSVGYPLPGPQPPWPSQPPPGQPTFPISGPPGIVFPPGPGYPPVAGHPLPPVPPAPGTPTFPIWGGPGGSFPGSPGYPPVAGHPLPQPQPPYTIWGGPWFPPTLWRPDFATPPIYLPPIPPGGGGGEPPPDTGGGDLPPIVSLPIVLPGEGVMLYQTTRGWLALPVGAPVPVKPSS